MPASETASARTSAVVTTDLPCIRCAYNLRTLPWNGICPECGHPVRHSRMPAGLRFHSFSEVRWARRSVALWVLGGLLSTLGYLALYVALICVWPRRAQVPPDPVVPDFVYKYLFRAQVHAFYAQMACTAAAIITFAIPIIRRRGTWDCWAAWTAMGTGFVGMVGAIYVNVQYYSQSAVSTTLNPYISYASSMLLALAIITWWILLAVQLGPGRRLLRLVFWGALAVPVLSLARIVLAGVVWFFGAHPAMSGGLAFWDLSEPPAWQASLTRILTVTASWESRLQLYVLVALLFYLLVLQRALARGRPGWQADALLQVERLKDDQPAARAVR
jgi:hypothetical protein